MSATPSPQSNPFNRLKDIAPHLWPQSLIHELDLPSPLPIERRIRGTVLKNPESKYYRFLCYLFKRLREDRKEDPLTALDMIPRILDKAMSYFLEDEKHFVSLSRTSYNAIDGVSVVVDCSGGGSIGPLPVYRYTDARHRHAKYKDLYEDTPTRWIKQRDTEPLQSYDILALLGQAMNLQEKNVATNPDGCYVVHLMYPDDDCREMTIITMHIHRDTVVEIQEGRPIGVPLRLTQDSLEIPDDDDLENNPVLQVLAEMSKDAARLVNETYPPEIWA
ncbi:hypothetical protein DXG01_002794 [Tephrocybe rancida]|nr:hypothetical protein DXG01_002794 [Tephrocybe rancida]